MSLQINMLLKNLINNISKKKKLKSRDYLLIAERLKKGIFFLLSEAIIIMGKNLLKMQLRKEHPQLYAQVIPIIKIIKF